MVEGPVLPARSCAVIAQCLGTYGFGHRYRMSPKP